MHDDRMMKLADKFINYDMIVNHTKLPELSEPRLRLLHAFLNQQLLDTARNELYTLVVSLVQLGLDTHDQVDTKQELYSEEGMRARQLNVLAGDYYSARFYQLLAKAGEVKMIASISNAVSEVNRLKIDFYMEMDKHTLKAEQYMNYAVQLRSKLFQHFSELFTEDYADIWLELLEGVSRCETVLQELERMKRLDQFSKSWAYWYVQETGSEEERHMLLQQESQQLAGLIDKYSIQEQLMLQLERAVKSVAIAMEKHPFDLYMKEIIQSIMDTLLKKVHLAEPGLTRVR